MIGIYHAMPCRNRTPNYMWMHASEKLSTHGYGCCGHGCGGVGGEGRRLVDAIISVWTIQPPYGPPPRLPCPACQLNAAASQSRFTSFFFVQIILHSWMDERTHIARLGCILNYVSDIYVYSRGSNTRQLWGEPTHLRARMSIWCVVVT